MRQFLIAAVFLLVGCSNRTSSFISTLPQSSQPQVVQTGSNGNWELLNVVTRVNQITAGSDGAIWGAGGNLIARIDMTGHETTYGLSGSNAGAIALNQDGNIYAAEMLGSGWAIARVTPNGGVTEFPLPSNALGPEQIVSGSDRNLWILGAAPGLQYSIARVTTNGVYTQIPSSLSYVYSITPGPDKNIWVAGSIGNTAYVAKILISNGSMTTYVIPNPYSLFNLVIASGADGGVWVTEEFEMVRVDPVTGAVVAYPANLGNGSNRQHSMVAGPNKLLYISGFGYVVGYSPTNHVVHGRVYYPRGIYGTPWIAAGPDEQLWTVTETNIAVLLLHKILPVPNNIVVSVGNSMGLAVSEPKSNQKRFSAVSNNPSVATVFGNGSSFTVTGVGVGTTTLTVSDKIGNTLDVPVTVQ
jgi:hypothetical protein